MLGLFAHEKVRETWPASPSLGRRYPVPPAMARFASVVLLAAALLMAGRLTYAGPSTTEVFWRAVLPGSAVPDAVLQLLRPATTTTSPTKRPASQGVPASGGGGDDPFGSYQFSDYDDDTASGGGGGGGDDPFGSYKFADYDDAAAASERSHRAPTAAVFFHEEAVRVGERLPLIHFRASAPAALGLLPRRAADSIPFTTAALPAVLALLGVPPGSSRAAAMAETLRACERRPAPAVAGEAEEEARFCATSLEAMVERAAAALGTRDVRAITSAVPRAGLPPQAYAVRTVRRVASGGGGSFVACHDEAYPYTVYLCHGTGPARAYLVEMEGARGGAVVTVAFVCHTDTSRWSPEHVSFKVLGTKPGGKPVCHLMPYGHIVWARNVKPSPAE